MPPKIVVSAGGFILQLMPGADDDTISFIENKISSIPPVSTLLAQNKSPEDILEMLLSEKDMKIIGKSPADTCATAQESEWREI